MRAGHVQARGRPEGDRPQDWRQLRRTTVYLEVELARRVNVYAAHHDLEQTAIIKAALEDCLERHGG